MAGPMIKYWIKGTEFAVWMHPRHEEEIATGKPEERLGGYCSPDKPGDLVIVCAGWLERADARVEADTAGDQTPGRDDDGAAGEGVRAV